MNSLRAQNLLSRRRTLRRRQASGLRQAANALHGSPPSTMVKTSSLVSCAVSSRFALSWCQELPANIDMEVCNKHEPRPLPLLLQQMRRVQPHWTTTGMAEEAGSGARRPVPAGTCSWRTCCGAATRGLWDRWATAAHYPSPSCWRLRSGRRSVTVSSQRRTGSEPSPDADCGPCPNP